MLGILSEYQSGNKNFDLTLTPFDNTKVNVLDAKTGTWQFVPNRVKEWFKHTGINQDQIVLYYNAVYFSIQELEITKTVGARDIAFTMWNAFFEPVSVTSVDIPAGSGITFSADEGLTFKPLELKMFNFRITKGSENIDGYITFTFSNGFIFKLKLNVVSTQYLVFQPEKRVDEKLTYKTEISQSMCKELRAKLAQNPLYKLKYQYILDENQLAQVVNDFQAQASENYIVPLWLHIYEAKELFYPVGTQSIEIKGSFPYLREGDHFVFTDDQSAQNCIVQSISGNVILLKNGLNYQFEGHCFIIPCRQAAALNGIDVSRELNGVFKMSIEYTFKKHTPNFKALDLPMLNGFPILSLPFRNGAMSNQQDIKIIQDTTTFPFVHINKERGLYTMNIDSDVDREKYFKWLDFINYCAGKFKSFWLPTRTGDFKLSTDAVETNSFISVDNRFGLKTGYGLAISLNNETNYYLIQNITFENGLTNIILDKPLPKSINISDNYRISLLLRCRLNDDEITIEHSDYYNKTISLSAIEVL